MALQRIIGAPLVAAACILGTCSAAAATVAWYRFENGVPGDRAHGRRTIVDSSGHALDGTPYGAMRYQPVANPDSAVAIHGYGTTGGIWVRDDPALALTQSLTIEAYVYLRPSTHGYTLLIRGDSRYAFDPYYILAGGDGFVQFLVAAEGGPASYISSTSLPLKQWVHVAGTLDDTTGLQALYVNGTQVASTVTTIRPFAALSPGRHGGLGIGNNIPGSPDLYPLDGSIDEVRLSDVALQPAEFLPPPVGGVR